MFVQVIRGKTSDPDALSGAGERWLKDLAPGAEGWLGSTIGVAGDGTFVAVARFSDSETARRNSDRPEQGAWWEQTSKHLSDVSFAESDDVHLLGPGGSDEARFVQVMFGKASDEAKVRDSMGTIERFMELRPDLLGGMTAFFGDGRYVDVAYFRSEEEARAGEAKELPEDLKQEYAKVLEAVEEIEYIDLVDPWTYSP